MDERLRRLEREAGTGTTLESFDFGRFVPRHACRVHVTVADEQAELRFLNTPEA